MKDFLKNLKIELAIAVLFVIGYGVMKILPDASCFNLFLLNYYTSDRLSGISAFFAITVGVYIAVITVFATSELGISKEILKRRLDRTLIDVMMSGMLENLIAVGLSTFVNLDNTMRYVLTAVIAIGIASFVKFIILLVEIFKANMEQMAKNIDEEEDYRNKILGNLEIISRYFQKHIDD